MSQQQRFPRIGVDVDGVLAEYVKPFCYLLNELGADIDWPFGPDFPPTWNWFEAYPSCTKELLAQAVEAIKESTGFWATLPAQPNCADDLRALVNAISHGWDIYFITNRPGFCAKFQTEVWLTARGIKVPYMPTVIITDSVVDKGLIANGLKLDAMVDDRPENLIACLSSCNKFLFDKPYNRAWYDTTGHQFCTRVTAVYQVLDAVADAWQAFAALEKH